MPTPITASRITAPHDIPHASIQGAAGFACGWGSTAAGAGATAAGVGAGCGGGAAAGMGAVCCTGVSRAVGSDWAERSALQKGQKRALSGTCLRQPGHSMV
ncbi:MAG TPA: hypothetical protein DGT21_03710 [Armatimonadetes bacterium]|nr:hypothetical protein [Armatimonadota bacterium]